MRKDTICKSRFLFIMLSSLFFVIYESCTKTDVKATRITEEIPTQIASGRPSLPHTKQFPADVATAWFTLLTDITRSKPYPPPVSFPIFTYSGLALYESVLPGMPSFQSVYKIFTGNTIEFDNSKDYYWPACANAAIASIASKIMQNYASPNLVPVQTLEASLNSSFQSIVTPEQLQRSNEFGRYVANMIYELRKVDGDLNPDGTLAICPPYVPLGNPWNWVPAPPGFLPAAGNCRGNLPSLIPNIVTTVLMPPHLDFSTEPGSAFYQAANEVYHARNNITADEIKIVNSWRDISGVNYNVLAHPVRIATDIIKKEKPDLEKAAVLFARITIAQFDALHAVFKSQFHYALLRPVTYVRNTMGDNTWTSVFTAPAHPSYPDEIICPASAVVGVLENHFGTSYAFVDSTHKSLYGERHYSSLNGLLTDIIQAKVTGGTNFRFACEAGVQQGRLVSQLVNALPLKKP